ncbi:hypothetical protein [Phyllobacterium endophyticum]|uniref:Uncharacterized protein n=1 Tax=Phyllobacterium endophyticum TaxID=1149773 RepID=A0A2P7ASG6_9HYPH|nr:hypothetical protein [Phyllobacterium endophyticum]MBB3236927.1 hypothetical protein [Phyllobacterium endophyticum]PSH57164.1 hypothetical protein CU100_18130 [Phyllobacterium endophyticum]TYR40443.1 hypothetical protein FY050_18140 [Phyllobacterium endophyticum]
MSLYSFFKEPNNFVAREKLLHMKAALDLKQTAAQHGIQLHLTEPEIDNQGYDFIAAVGYDQVYLQNKATLDDANVSMWKIHPMHLNVPLQERDLSPSIDGWPIGGGEGAMGGVLLHLIDAEAAKADDLQISYFYFDIFYASAVASGLWETPKFNSMEAADILRKVRDGGPGDRITLPFRAFLPIRSPSSILALRLHIPQPSNYISLGHRAESGSPGPLREMWRTELARHLPVSKAV